MEFERAVEAVRAEATSGVQAKTPPQFKPGFRDLRWGDKPKTGMEPLRDDGEEALYMRTTDNMRFGDGQLGAINYQFRNGTLAGVVLQIAPGSLQHVLDALRASYGSPSQPKNVPNKFYWLSLGSGEDLTQAMVDADLERQSGTVVIFSKAVADQRKAEAKRADEQASAK